MAKGEAGKPFPCKAVRELCDTDTTTMAALCQLLKDKTIEECLCLKTC